MHQLCRPEALRETFGAGQAARIPEIRFKSHKLPLGRRFLPISSLFLTAKAQELYRSKGRAHVNSGPLL